MNHIYHLETDTETYLDIMKLLRKKEESRIKTRERYRKDHNVVGRTVSEKKPFIKVVNITTVSEHVVPAVVIPEKTVTEVNSIMSELKL